jgi:hypothetical protein
MTTRVRLLLLACLTGAALALAGGALAAFTPTMSVSAKPAGTGSSGISSIRVTVPRDDEALAAIAIFAPLGYTATLGQSAGTVIGSVTAQVLVREPIAGAVLPITGTIEVADPASVAAAVTQCTGTPTHAALWVLVLQAAGQTLRVPVAVDPAPAPLSAFASYWLRICLPNPNIPVASGGAAFGAKLINAQLNIRNVFTTPNVAGDHVWRAVAVPWPAGAGAPVVANTREARAHIGLAANATVTVAAGRKVGRNRTMTMSGAVREQGRGIAGASVRIAVGSVARTVRTGANGTYRATFRLRRGRRYAASVRVTVAERAFPSACATPGPFQAGATPIPCATETQAYYEPAPTGAPAADNTTITASRAFRVR